MNLVREREKGFEFFTENKGVYILGWWPGRGLLHRYKCAKQILVDIFIFSDKQMKKYSCLKWYMWLVSRKYFKFMFILAL